MGKKTIVLNEFICGNDLVIYNDSREILGWMLYSDHMDEWFTIPLEVIKEHSVAKWERIVNIIEHQPVNCPLEAKADHDIDLDRDDKIINETRWE